VAKALTAASIEKFKPGAARREIPDGLLGGLYLIVQPSGARSWAVRYRLRGKPTKFTIGAYPAFDLAAARKAAREVLQEVARGGDPARQREERRRAEAADDDFEAVARLWIERDQRPHNRTWLEAARLLGLRPDPEDEKRLVATKGGLVDRWGDRKLADIRRADIIYIMDSIVARGVPYVANRTVGCLRSLFSWCISRDMITANPCIGVKPQPEKSRDRVLDDEELQAVWTAADKLGWPFGPIVQLLILTGARREEIGALRWSEVKGDQIELSGDRTKNGQPHIIPLSAPAIAIIENLHRVHGSKLVFTSTGETPVSGFSKVADRLDAMLGLPDWRLHDLRRTVATGLQRLGTRLEVTEAVLGHTSGSRAGVVGIYQRHDWADEKRAALDAWARHVVALLEGAPENVVELARVRA
jgi:integrase